MRRFNQLLSLNLKTELIYCEMGNSEFPVSEWLNCVSSFNSEYVEFSVCTMTMKGHD